MKLYAVCLQPHHESIDLEESLDPPHPDPPHPPATTNMLDILLNSINDGTINAAIPDQDGTLRINCENELYQLLFGNDFKMKTQNIETKIYNCLPSEVALCPLLP
jgi:hypothetical protein